MNEENIYHLADIISKFLKAEAAPEEAREVERWRDASPEHARLLQRFSSRAFLERRRVDELSRDTAGAFRRFISRQRVRRARRHAMAMVGTAAAVLLVVGLLVSRRETLPSAEILALSAGESRALLTLGDGQRVALGNGRDAPLLAEHGIAQDTARGFIAYSDGEEGEIAWHRVETPRKGEYHVVLADSTRVWLNAESALRFPTRFAGKERRVALEGEAYFEVSPDARQPFVVEANGTETRVLGTTFNARAYVDEGKVVMTLLEGSVQFSLGDARLVLRPNEQGTADLVTREVGKQTVETRLYTGWKEGRFIFEGQTLEEIMKTLHRWYDVNIYFKNDAARRSTFNGNLERYNNFNRIVELLEMTGAARFTIESNNIYIE
ncbi:MAG: DUF4974 domain-containing protein [Odoribacteraceae bacterium]|jgi:ferric-dicitrate binding protein FerR (iron transport regulator)|nr:DUF4974 domain-containing protein [Odoribacteraceae bacterium]